MYWILIQPVVQDGDLSHGGEIVGSLIGGVHNSVEVTSFL